jgi:DNA-binding NtrC family response regulator/tetratricopeptide (TPR) repeat protein
MQWLADRFFSTGHQWIDAATARRVRIRVSAADMSNDIDWSEECATLATLRHPLLNCLVDYGIGPNGCRFEAYESSDPAQVNTVGDFGERLLQHLTRFLRGCRVQLPPERGAVAVRPIVSGRLISRRPLGIRLQRRRALESIEETLDAFSPAGPSVVRVCGSNNAGLRTLATIVARGARLRGFVPLSPATIRRHAAVLAAIRDRHVCLLDDLQGPERSAAAVSSLISTLAAASARRHVVFRFIRDETAGAAVRLDPLSIRAMTAMIFADGAEAPGEEEMIAAARAADGLPGLYLARLTGACTVTSRSIVVHETPGVYTVDTPAPVAPAIICGRVLGAALRARERAATLAARGRHSVAVRVLKRGIRVLEGRERATDAAECALQLGWLLLDRGRTTAAWEAFERAQRSGADAAVGVSATIGLGITLTDDRRLIEAEAVLRGALAAAETIQHTGSCLAAAAALTRCLMWQGRNEEAAAAAGAYRNRIIDAPLIAPLWSALARTQARLGRVALAVRTARDAQRASVPGGPRVAASSELALAEALGAAGDGEGKRAAIARAVRIARASHLPLVRVRAALIHNERSAAMTDRLRKLKLPSLLAHRLEEAAAAVPVRIEPVAEIEKLLDVAQRAADDTTAATQICRVVSERLCATTTGIFGSGRALAVHGRGWPDVPLHAKQVLACGGSLCSESGHEPRESAEPIRYGGEVIGALACRWVAGVVFDADTAAIVLRAAALSAAPHIRALLDRPDVPPAAAWGDLLGDSAAAASLREQVSRAARAPFPVLIEGESGSGKELVARALHRFSARRDRRFCALNCAALTDDLVESELFGHARGAFTGAATERPGLFEEADGGTLFLDEIGELSARAQAKLLRVLQEGEVRRVGENFARHVDVRVVAATNRRLEEEVAAGRFRADLRFRLDVVRVIVPPLRERITDIPLLASHFWQDASTRVGSRATLSPDALAALARYDWPGNVRELQNVVAWIAVHAPRRGRIGTSALPRHLAQATATTLCTFEAAREEFERRFVRAALAGANGQRSRAAAALGVTRQGLSKMMKRLQIQG